MILRQENFSQFKIGLGYLLSHRLISGIEHDPISKGPKLKLVL